MIQDQIDRSRRAAEAEARKYQRHNPFWDVGAVVPALKRLDEQRVLLTWSFEAAPVVDEDVKMQNPRRKQKEK